MFNFLDIVFAAIALFFLIRGVFRGLFKEVASTVGVVAAYVVASNYNEVLVPFYQTWFKNPGLLHFLAYVTLFAGVMVGVMFLAWLLARILHITPVFWLDIPGGAAVGLVKAWLMCCVILVGLNSFMPDAKFLEESATVPYLRPGAGFLAKVLPDDMKDFDPASLARTMNEQSQEAVQGLVGGEDSEARGEDSPGMKEKSMELLQKMGDVLKNLKKDDSK
ncbi:CvpA family protein [Desulfocurvus sp. DL9XJH121]